MRISIFLNNDLESNIALNCLLPELSKHEFNVFLSQKVGPANQIIPALQHLDFLEREFIQTKLFPMLEAEHRGDGFLTFKQIGQTLDVEIMQIDEIVSERTISTIKEFNADVFLSIRFGKIFKGEILSVPPLGIINLHSAILPNYKGVLGTLRAFIDDKKTIGSTIHYITNSSIDTGEIISINQQNVIPGKSVLWHIIQIYPYSIKKLCAVISELSNIGKVKSVKQTDIGNYFSFPNESDLSLLKQRGYLLFNLMEYIQSLSDFYKVDKQWIQNELQKSGLPETW